jgi:serine/threonine protein kinase
VEPVRAGGYRLLRKLGKGAAGTVYLAKDPDGETVAVKLLHSGAGPEDRARLLRECQLTARLEHRNVVKVRGVNEQAGRFFLVLDWIDGCSLQERIQARPLDVNLAARLAERLARALQHAHEHGVLHRDVKPSNVLLDRRGEPLLIDFGLAKDRKPGTGTQMTMEGDVLGTPSFMAPEQALGELERIGPRVDVYGLGATLYCMLTGLPPFAGQFVRVLTAVVHSRPVPPSSLANVDEQLDRIVLKCLEKDPDDRYRSALDLAQDLRRYVRRCSGGRITTKIAAPRPSSGRLQSLASESEQVRCPERPGGLEQRGHELWLPSPRSPDQEPELSLCKTPEPNDRREPPRRRRRGPLRNRSSSQRWGVERNGRRLASGQRVRLDSPRAALSLGTLFCVLLAGGVGLLLSSGSSPAAAPRMGPGEAGVAEVPKESPVRVSDRLALTPGDPAIDRVANRDADRAAQGQALRARQSLNDWEAAPSDWEHGLEERAGSSATAGRDLEEPDEWVGDSARVVHVDEAPPDSTRAREMSSEIALAVLRSGSVTVAGVSLSLGDAIPTGRVQIGSRVAEVESEGAVRVAVAPRSRLNLRRGADGHVVFRLERGALFARTDGKRAYAVETPDGLMTPLGTEFLVSVSGSRKTRCATFDGMVQVSDPSPQSSGLELIVRPGFEAKVSRGRVSRLPGAIDRPSRALQWLPTRIRPEVPALPRILRTFTFDGSQDGRFTLGTLRPVGALRSRACLEGVADKNASVVNWAEANAFPLNDDVWVEVMCRVSRPAKVTFKVHGASKSVKIEIPEVSAGRWTPLFVPLLDFRSSSGSSSIADLEGPARRLQIKAGCSDDVDPVVLSIDNLRIYALGRR